MAELEELTQESYQESAYSDSSWEVLGELSKNDQFTPYEFQVLTTSKTMTDPMFKDYGGVRTGAEEKRFHCPYTPVVEQEATQAQIEEARKLSLTPEELEARLKGAFERGKKEGMAETVAANSERFSTLETRMRGVIQDIGRQLNENLERIEQQALSLSVTIAEKIIGYAAEINPEYLVPLVKEAIRHSGSAVIKRVRVSREDMEFIRVVGMPSDLKEGDAKWEFEADDTIKTGCVVDTSAGEIDFRLDKAWERVRDKVLQTAKSATQG